MPLVDQIANRLAHQMGADGIAFKFVLFQLFPFAFAVAAVFKKSSKLNLPKAKLMFTACLPTAFMAPQKEHL